jgi:hypothetical protein
MNIYKGNNGSEREAGHYRHHRLQWYGHVKRMHNERLPKLIMEWIPGERRKRGRPRKTWMEGVRAVMKTRHLEAEQKGMMFGFLKMATAVTRPERYICRPKKVAL